ncbi:hypothetical protein AWENTII_009037 [Aspergillus wentii]
MHLTCAIVALMAASAMAVATPAEDGTGPGWPNCPNDWKHCGVCNGVSCNVMGIDYVLLALEV